MDNNLVNFNSMTPDSSDDSDDLMGELENLFGSDDDSIVNSEKVVLKQNLDGFASCFPEWDLHPPKR